MVLEQTKKSKEISKIAIVTSVNKLDDKVLKYCKNKVNNLK